MRLRIHWSGTGEPLLLLPGWNTTASAVRSWLPASFLGQYRCGILEWPGLGKAVDEPLPDCLDGLLDDLEEALPVRPVAVVGFCMGGIAAWAFAQRHPGSVRSSVLVESPLHFPLVLTTLLVPGLGWVVLRLAQGTLLGRHLVRRAILQAQIRYPGAFLDDLFDYEAKAAIHYLGLFKGYGKALGSSQESRASACSCWQMAGEHRVKVLAPRWGPRHRVQATAVSIQNAGHFPAVEAPAVFFACLQGVLAGL